MYIYKVLRVYRKVMIDETHYVIYRCFNGLNYILYIKKSNGIII